MFAKTALFFAGAAAGFTVGDARLLGGNAAVVSWVPTSECHSPVKVCYQGEDEAALEKVSQIDIFNPCKATSTIEHKSCADAGFTKKLGADPVFKKLDLYVHVPSLDSDSLTAVDIALNIIADDTDQACWKGARSRGFGRIEKDGKCNDDEDKEALICYPKCKSDEEGIGPVCWANCKGDYSASVGPLCCKESGTCEKDVAKDAAKIGVDIAKAVADKANPAKLLADLKKIYDDAKELGFPLCSKVPSPTPFDEILFK